MIGMMNPAIHIRATIFGCATQEAFARLMGTTQVTISRWERAGRIPGPKQQAVRDLARTREIRWDDRWFFEVPVPASEVA